MSNDTLFAGKPVQSWMETRVLPDPDTTAIRLSFNSYDDDHEAKDFGEYFARFLQQPGLERIDTLLIGCWGEPFEESVDIALAPLVAAAERLPALRHLAIADMSYEECEVSWIRQGDLSALYPAFPALETLFIKGSDGLDPGEIHLPRLRSLTLMNGGLPAQALARVSAADLPMLEHLELWLGDDGYGCDLQNEDLQALLAALPRFPQLAFLALCNFCRADDLAALLPTTTLPPGLRTLDLSRGTLTDAGGESLLKSAESFRNLELLDLHHHYLSTDMMERLRALPCPVDLSEQCETHVYGNGREYRGVFLSE